jgi:hypothetical protein
MINIENIENKYLSKYKGNHEVLNPATIGTLYLEEDCQSW